LSEAAEAACLPPEENVDDAREPVKNKEAAVAAAGIALGRMCISADIFTRNRDACLIRSSIGLSFFFPTDNRS